MKKALKIIGFILLVIFAVFGLYKAIIYFQYLSIKAYAEDFEKGREYDPELLYLEKGGEPLLLVNKDYDTTLYFVEGFRALAPAGMYSDWFHRLHNEHKVNIIVPVYGLQSFPFEQRDRGDDWHYQEDMRTGLQIYDAYTSLLPQEHRVVTASMSFGTLINLTICVKSNRKPDSVVLMSPLNSYLDFKAAGELVHWFSKQTSWLRYVMPYSKAGTPPNRVSPWDIVNDEKNKEVYEKFYMNPEDSAEYGYQNEVVAKWMEDNLIPRVKDMDITVIWGDSDLYFNQDGFRAFAGMLEKSGNDVETYVIENSGHMVLMDNGEEKVKDIVLDVLK
jgi:pimeloyl-ACP methyl ester carboxylesterase